MTEDARDPWRGRTGEFSPTYYAHQGPNATSETLRELLTARVGPDASILEVGCNVGRHLSLLHEAGFQSLTGIDINPDALDELRKEEPALAADGTFVVADLISFLATAPTDGFDVIYSVETLQHIPPEETTVFDDIARVAGKVVITVENESDDEKTTVNGEIPLYHRDWQEIFTARGMVEIAVSDRGRDTLRAFVHR